MATLTVRNLDEDLVKRLRVRAAEHREILRAALEGGGQHAAREQAASRLAEFRHRTAGRGSPSSADLLAESRRGRAEALAGGDEGA